MKSKKLLTAILTLSMSVSISIGLVACLSKNKHEIDDRGKCTACGALKGTEGVLYDISEDGTYAEVIGYEGEETEVYISCTYNNLPVKRIDDFAFYNNLILMVLHIPDTVSEIGDNAFDRCYFLRVANIGDGVQQIGDFAFQYCDDLRNVHIGDGIKTIGKGAFQQCDSLVDVSIGEGLQTIGDAAFYGCKMSRMVIPEGVTTIGNSAFYFCNRLTSVIIPDSVLAIGSRAFYECVELESVEMGDGLIAIESETFFGCRMLTNLTMGSSITEIGDSAFYNCAALTHLTLPVGITEIGDFAFNSYKGSVLISDSVQTIGKGAFRACSEIQVAQDNKAYKSIDGNLYTKDGAVFIEYASKNPETDFIIPDSVARINDYAFYDASLFQVDFGNVSEIGIGAFYSCGLLKRVIFSDELTSIENDAFAFAGSFATYYEGTAEQWSEIEIEESNIGLLEKTPVAGRYYYVENQKDVPLDGGKYWHYNANGEAAVWVLDLVDENKFFVEGTVCDFSTIIESVQYANESNKFGSITVKTHNNGCYFATELRIYDDALHDGWATIVADRTIATFDIRFNGTTPADIYGNGPTLNIYISTDGENWELVDKIAVMGYPIDYTVDIDSTQGYRYLKLDPDGSNVSVISCVVGLL